MPQLLFVYLVFAPPIHAEAPIFPSGSHIGLVPPEGLVVSPSFAGFEDQEASTSIMINTMPREAFDEMATGMTAERVATQGMTLLGPCAKVRSAFKSRCFRLTQEAGGYLFQKWILIARFETETALVVATIPDVVVAEGIYSESEIEAALSSLTYREMADIEPIDALPFTIEEGNLLPFQRAIGGSTALFAGADASETPQPLWVVAASLESRVGARDVDFARLAFQQISTLSEAKVNEERTISLERMEGHILEGTGKDKESGSDLYVFQAVLVDAKDKYYRLVGIVPSDRRTLYRPEFLRLMHTLRPK